MTTRRTNRRAMTPRLDQLDSRQLLSTAPITGLHIVASPIVAGSVLNGTAAIASNDIWTVGDTSPVNGTEAPLVEHFNGTSWSVVPTPAPAGGSVGALNSVSALAGNNVWAVGESVGNGTAQPLVEHWDGSKWSLIPSPSLPSGGELNSVKAVSANDIWAVGNLGFGAGNLIEHWDGTAWSVVPSPAFTPNDVLFGVTATSATDAWAVGKIGRHPAVEILHWDGKSWSQVAAPSPFFDSELRSVTALSPTNVWAVGSGGTSPAQTLIEHWDGTSWSVVASPTPQASPVAPIITLNSVAAVSANDIWAVGDFSDPKTGFQRTLTEHWDGTSWTIVASPNAGTGHNYLNGVTALSDGTVVAVGYASNFNAIILQK